MKSNKAKCLIIGEVAQAHDGSLGQAHAYIDAIAAAGADAVKFQTHIAEAESSPAEPWRVKFSRQDSTRFAYWKRMEFTEEQWSGLKTHAEERGLLFLSSPFSVEAADMLFRLGIRAWKVASGEVNNPVLFDYLLGTGLPLLVSSGMSSIAEIDRLVSKMRAQNADFTLLQCSSIYPCPPEKVGLNILTDFKERYYCPVGLSDHSGTIFPGLAAVALGADVLEVHVTFSREMFGPDVPASITTGELNQLAEGVRFIEKMNLNPVEKDQLCRELTPLRDIFTKSLVVKKALPAGTVLQKEHLTAKKPGTGIPAEEINKILGRKISRSLQVGEFLKLEDLEE